MSLTIDRRSINALKLAAGAANWTQIAQDTFLIPSQSDPSHTYVTTPRHCTCPDSDHHAERLCKHQIAASLVVVLIETAVTTLKPVTDADVDRIFARA